MSPLRLRDVAENLPHTGKSYICVTTQNLSLIDETEQVSGSGVSQDFWNTIKICWHTVYFCYTAQGIAGSLYREDCFEVRTTNSFHSYQRFQNRNACSWCVEQVQKTALWRGIQFETNLVDSDL